jgi:hypothetical protein
LKLKEFIEEGEQPNEEEQSIVRLEPVPVLQA